MATPRHLSSAPITEAVFDFRVRARRGLTLESFDPLKSRLQSDLPGFAVRRGYEVELSTGDATKGTFKELGPDGYVFKSADGLSLAQFRIDGFTLNRLKPYTSWEELFPQALSLWGLYLEYAEPELVTRLAVRYINHITLGGENLDFDDYLEAAAPIPQELPQVLGKFLSRVTVHDPETGVFAHLTQSVQPAATENTWTALIDIDAFVQADLGFTSTEIEETFRVLREFKNKAFFSLLTEKALEEFE